ncbi:hypothetical protein [Paracoccus sanguinis]|uniref:hypothetical protein n=1 Tax=Paracoccus sanguinis TaxID=1545044 RepID=UPI000691D72E|nr:hypothetical protein [Paracoccus sanguinis]
MTTFIKIFTADAVMDLDRDGIEVSNSLVRSADRVRDQAEVFTADREVRAMLDLVGEEASLPPTTILEPSCGNGNFLVEILTRKLDWIERHGDDDPDRRAAAAVIALASIVGIDISVRNVRESQQRLMDLMDPYLAEPEWRSLAEAIVSSNVVVGNFLKCNAPAAGTPEALAIKAVDALLMRPSRPAEFSEKIRAIRLRTARSEGVHTLTLLTGLIGGTEETLDAFEIDSTIFGKPRLDGVALLSVVIRFMAVADESQIYGEEPKVRHIYHSSCAGRGDIAIPDGPSTIIVSAA